MNGKPSITHFISIFLLLLVALVAACSRPIRHDARLVRVSGIVSDDPGTALRILDSIDSKELSDPDRHYYDFLTIKAKDKNYVQHKSDSLILDVLDYYSDNQKDLLYSESLYYAGRVYSDIGDFPTALQYYQKASDQLKTTSGKDDLKVRIDNQTGMLLERLRLYDQAINYYKDVLNQKMSEGDSIGIVYTLQRLGRIRFDSALQNVADSISYKYLNEADSLLSLSLDYAITLPESFSAMSRVFLSGVKQKKGNLEHAHKLIKYSLDLVEPDFRNVALAYATSIYIDAGVTDTAFIYAHELISNDNPLNKKSGYRFLLSPELRNYIHPDSLNRYYDEYDGILEEFFDENSNAQTLLQDTQYNYQLHERESMKAHKANERLQWAIAGFVFLVLVLTIVVLYLKYRNKANILELRETLHTLEKLKHNIAMSESDYNNVSKNNDDSGSIDGSGANDKPKIHDKIEDKDTSETSDRCGDNEEFPDYASHDSVKELRERLLMEAIELSKRGEQMGVSPIILESEVYSQLRDLVASQSIIKDEMWNDIEKIVLSAYPHFNTRLRILTRNKISIDEFRVAWLVKCGFKPMEMCSLLAITHGAINSRRARIGIKIKNEKLSVTIIDNIIRTL